MTSNREKAAEVIADALRPALSMADGIGGDLARALAAEGVLAPESAAELVRLRRELEERREYLTDSLSNESIESYDDLDNAWVSVQKYGELSEMIDESNFITRILDGSES